MFYFTFLFSVPKAKSSPSKIVHMPATQQALHQTPRRPPFNLQVASPQVGSMALFWAEPEQVTWVFRSPGAHLLMQTPQV